MSNPPPFKAAVRPELNDEAQRLVDVYNNTFGATGPGCCPEAVAAVFRDIVRQHELNYHYVTLDDLRALARSLEGDPNG